MVDFFSVFIMLFDQCYNMVDDEKLGIDHSQQHLANERTFLAWVRTCIALIGLGFIVAKFSFFMVEFRLLIQQEYSSGPNRQAINTHNLRSIKFPI
jgi:uncharacterized membrane protein YidH (DUF202 family)